MKFRICMIVLLLLGSVQFRAAAQEDSGLKMRFEKDLMEKGKEVHTISCRFVQTRSMSVLANEVQKLGVFSYDVPENMLLSFDDGDYILMTETSFRMKNGEHVSQTRISSNPMLRELKRLLSACMTGQVLEVSGGFQLSLEEDEKTYLLDMKPVQNRKNSRISRMRMVFDKKDMSLNFLKMEEASGDYTAYEFFEKKFNTTLNEGLFDL